MQQAEMVELGKSTSIWLPEETLEVWRRFKKIAEREGRSAGQILIDFVANYVRIHEPGNPQWPINRFFEKSEANVETSLCLTTSI